MPPRHQIPLTLILTAGLISGCATKPKPPASITPQTVNPAPTNALVSTDFVPDQENDNYPRPRYPLKMIQQGQNGEVKLDVTVSEDGTPEKISVVESTNEHFTAAALSTIRQWKFTPKIEDGKPVRQRYLIPFIFKVLQN